MREMIILVGPQGCGKTTQASLLQKTKTRKASVRVTSLSNYTLFQVKFTGLLIRLMRAHTIQTKFYEDLPPRTLPAPEIWKKFFVFLIALHFLSFVLSRIKLCILKLSYTTLIEHEGYVLKEISDLYYLANMSNISLNGSIGGLLRNLETLLLAPLRKNSITIVHLEGQPESLKPRYMRRGTGIEPSDYIRFQNMMYRKLTSELEGSIKGAVVRIDSSRSISQVHQQIISLTSLD